MGGICGRHAEHTYTERPNMSRRCWWPLALLAISSAASAAVPISGERILLPGTPLSTDQFVPSRDRLYVLDTDGHRVLVYRSGALWRQIGQIGQEDGNFYYPSEIAGDPSGTLYVFENASGRVQLFDRSCRLIARLWLPPKCTGFAVNSKGEIHTFMPGSEALITVFDRRGQMVRSFGARKRLSDFYGTSINAVEDEKTKIAINRCWIAADREDNVYVAFVGAPYIAKYNSAGRLLFERRIPGREADEVFEKFARDHKWNARRTVAGDGSSTPYITTGFCIDSDRAQMYVSIQAGSTWVYTGDLKGNPIGVIEPVAKGNIANIAVSEDGGSLYAVRISTKVRHDMYRFPLAVTKTTKGATR